MNYPIPSASLSYDEYKKSLIAFLKTKPQYTDYDFEGSNWSVVIDILAFNTYNNAHSLNMVGSEAWTDSAQMRESLVSHATDLNYLPRSRISAYATITVEIFPTGTPSSITLPKFYKFKSSDSVSNTIYFVTNRDYVTTRDEDGRYLFENVEVFEGSIATEFFLASGITTNTNGFVIYDEQFIIQAESIDITSLEVYVRSSQNDPVRIKYERADTLQGLNNESLVFFLRGVNSNQYALEFGDGVFGSALSNGNVIEAVFRNSRGVTVQGNYVLSKTGPIDGFNDIQVLFTTRVQGGFERETTDEIRFNAPRHFQTQNRAVTPFDYETLIKENFPQVQQVSVFGGEEIYQYGKVMIVLKPYGTQGIASDSLKNQIINFLKSKNIVPEPVIIDPQYFYLGINGDATYRGDMTKLDTSQIRSNIYSKLLNLNNTLLGDFNVDVYQSFLTETIVDSDPSIRGSSVDLSLYKLWLPLRNTNDTFTATLNNPIKKSRDGEYRNANDYSITTNSFLIFQSDQQREVVIQDDGLGNLHYYTLNQSIKSRFGSKIGTVDYDTGEVKLTANILDYNERITFHFLLEQETINVIRDNFVIVDGPYIDIKVNKI